MKFRSGNKKSRQHLRSDSVLWISSAVIVSVVAVITSLFLHVGKMEMWSQYGNLLAGVFALASVVFVVIVLKQQTETAELADSYIYKIDVKSFFPNIVFDREEKSFRRLELEKQYT